jgi:alkylated DNA nucleotide flippase Atl1
MPKPKPSWTEKLHRVEGYPQVKPIDEHLSRRWGKGTMVIPAPTEVDDLMRQVPAGKVTTMNEIRVALARKHGATVACPITTGIFGWIAAHAAEEQRQNGVAGITPYWRTLKTGGFLNEKYPGGVEAQKQLLESDGLVVVRNGKSYVVQNYEQILARL